MIIGGFVIVSLVSALGVSKAERRAELISPVVTITPTATLTSLPTVEPTPTASPTAKVAPKRVVVTATPKPTPTTEPKENVNKLVDKYSAEYGLDVNVVRHLGICESGFRSNATNGKYVGLFQYDAQTWKTIRAEMNLDTDPNLRYSAEEAIRTTTYALSKGKRKLWPNCVP